MSRSPVPIPVTNPVEPRDGLTCLAVVDDELQPVLLLARHEAKLSATWYWEVTTLVGDPKERVRAPVSEGAEAFRELTRDWLLASLIAVNLDIGELQQRAQSIEHLMAAPQWRTPAAGERPPEE